MNFQHAEPRLSKAEMRDDPRTNPPVSDRWESIACENLAKSVRATPASQIAGFPDGDALLHRVTSCAPNLSGDQLLELNNTTSAQFSAASGQSTMDDITTLRKRIKNGDSLDMEEVKILDSSRAQLSLREKNFVDSRKEFPNNEFAAKLAEKYRNHESLTADEDLVLRKFRAQRVNKVSYTEMT